MSVLNGLVLAGGESRRMGEDKALLKKDGVSLLRRSLTLLRPHCDATFVSVRQVKAQGERAEYDQIADQFGGQGPVDGIASAQVSNPTAAWLVVACDLPQLDAETLAYLVDNRSADHDVTAYVSVNDGLPEPLCAIYEPSSAAPIRGWLDAEVRCARKVVLRLNHHLLDQPNAGALDNANTPQDWQAISTGVSFANLAAKVEEAN